VETQPNRLGAGLARKLSVACFLISGLGVTHASSLSGADVYHQYCAVCHGQNGKGDGPVADALRVKPADLTLLSAKNNGKFPEMHVLNFIRSNDTIRAHGSRQMPVWGRVFLDETGGQQELVQMRLYAVVVYLKQLQVK
jgi:mono/diheme cytochrome c family protein